MNRDTVILMLAITIFYGAGSVKRQRIYEEIRAIEKPVFALYEDDDVELEEYTLLTNLMTTGEIDIRGDLTVSNIVIEADINNDSDLITNAVFFGMKEE